MTEKSGVSRRELFQIAGSVPALAAATAGAGVAQTHDTHAGAYQRKVFDEHDWHTVHVLCDLIVPADERSGSATAAGVPEFIDDWLDFRKQEDGHDDLTAQMLGGLAWLDRESSRLFGKAFGGVPVDQQKQILDRIAWPERAAPEDRRWAEFFSQFRDLTLNGFYSSKVGIADLPYLGNTAVEQWKGCDPAVWAKIEERMKNGYKGLGGEVKRWG
ncbi:MAG: gluconate 2-dehydrogenase subunit 3 family protein [Bryobacteraceae bacterium]|jgi:gluconate 2-dehydrogenase subunit 3-like protein